MNTLIFEAKNLWSRYRFEITLGLVFFIIATFAFGLGYLTHMRTAQAPIVLELQPPEVGND